jgi:pilus assembly protein CpaE
MRALLIILSTPEREAWAREIAEIAGVAEPLIMAATPAQAASYLEEQQITPSHMVIDIGPRSEEVLVEIDVLAQQCEAGTRVIATGDANDIVLYRGLLARGVTDYLPMPLAASEVVRILSAPLVAAPAAPATMAPSQGTSSYATPAPSMAAHDPKKRVLTFLSAGSGDGASTAAVNSAYAIAQIHNGNTVLVDMDYQFGMVAKHLNLQSPYGIREIFDHPDRGMDTTLIRRMVASYGKLDVITAPQELRYLPMVSAQSIQQLISTLKLTYDNIILDLPHVWLPWVASVAQHSTNVVMVAQLWLKSASHASRLMRVLRELDIPNDRIITVINRSGAKFKEAVDSRDFERVCSTTIHYTLNNDIKTIVAAEASARTVMEMDPSLLATDINRLAHGLCNRNAPERVETTAKPGLFHMFKR